MRLLTFQIDGHRLAVPAEAVASVGRPYKKEKVHPVDVRVRLGGRAGEEAGQPVITCRVGRRLIEFAVDRVLNLGEYSEGRIRPLPSALAGGRLFRGVADLDTGLFLMLDLEALSPHQGRSGR